MSQLPSPDKNALPTREEFIAKLHKQAACVYLACEPDVAKDISESLSHAAMLLTIAVPSHVDAPVEPVAWMKEIRGSSGPHMPDEHSVEFIPYRGTLLDEAGWTRLYAHPAAPSSERATTNNGGGAADHVCQPQPGSEHQSAPSALSSTAPQSDSVCWLLERGQAVGHAPTVWLKADNEWTEDAAQARKFTSKAEAEQEADRLFGRFTGDGTRRCIATEHVFIMRDDRWIGGAYRQIHVAVSATRPTMTAQEVYDNWSAYLRDVDRPDFLIQLQAVEGKQ